MNFSPLLSPVLTAWTLLSARSTVLSGCFKRSFQSLCTVLNCTHLTFLVSLLPSCTFYQLFSATHLQCTLWISFSVLSVFTFTFHPSILFAVFSRYGLPVDSLRVSGQKKLTDRAQSRKPWCKSDWVRFWRAGADRARVWTWSFGQDWWFPFSFRGTCAVRLGC